MLGGDLESMGKSSARGSQPRLSVPVVKGKARRRGQWRLPLTVGAVRSSRAALAAPATAKSATRVVSPQDRRARRAVINGSLRPALCRSRPLVALDCFTFACCLSQPPQCFLGLFLFLVLISGGGSSSSGRQSGGGGGGKSRLKEGGWGPREDGSPRVYSYRVLRELPHDGKAFTQGLQFDRICGDGGKECRCLWAGRGAGMWGQGGALSRPAAYAPSWGGGGGRGGGGGGGGGGGDLPRRGPPPPPPCCACLLDGCLPAFTLTPRIHPCVIGGFRTFHALQRTFWGSPGLRGRPLRLHAAQCAASPLPPGRLPHNPPPQGGVLGVHRAQRAVHRARGRAGDRRGAAQKGPPGGGCGELVRPGPGRAALQWHRRVGPRRGVVTRLNRQQHRQSSHTWGTRPLRQNGRVVALLPHPAASSPAPAAASSLCMRPLRFLYSLILARV